jgi:hypothetical protein
MPALMALFLLQVSRFRVRMQLVATYDCLRISCGFQRGNFSKPQDQIADAVQFVEQNRNELARLVGFPGVEYVSVDFGIEERDVAVQREKFPPNLLATFGGLGICLEFTLYPCRKPTNS